MKHLSLLASLLILNIILFSGCAVAGGIFKAGFWTGILLVVVAIAAIIFIIRKIGGNKNG